VAQRNVVPRAVRLQNRAEQTHAMQRNEREASKQNESVR
jgi:hypothetical protein